MFFLGLPLLDLTFCLYYTVMAYNAMRVRQQMGGKYILVAVVCVLLPTLATASVSSPSLLPSKFSKQANRPSERLYGIDLNGYIVETSMVRSGQTLSTMLRPYKVPVSVIFQAAAISESVFDVRQIKAGRPYTIIRDSKRGLRVKYLIYDQNSKKYIVFDFGNPLRVYAGRKALEIKIRFVPGTITTSLWNAFAEQRLNPDLVLRLADLFANKVDFHKLRKGDHFKLIYEEMHAEGRLVGIGAIKAAVLTIGGNIQQAFQFRHHDGKVGYYDENGLNFQKAFLKSPLKHTRVSSGFSEKRLHPVKKSYRRHPGIDYAAPAGTPVMSVGDGIIGEIGYSRTAGKFIKIKHPGPYVSQYFHLSSIENGIEMNSPVNKGDIIGLVGSTGLATGPHLDFRFKKNDRYVDFLSVPLPSGKSVDIVCKERFNQIVSQYISKLSFTPEIAFVTEGEWEERMRFFETVPN
jgi:murein DD-endopeptidase MepM/ murein hydrolase activator NlpD